MGDFFSVESEPTSARPPPHSIELGTVQLEQLTNVIEPSPLGATTSWGINRKRSKSRYFDVNGWLKSTREGCYRRYFPPLVT